MSEHCELCSVYLQSKNELKSHLAGKKHLKKLHLMQLVERSIYVSPVPKFISKDEFINFFSTYGNIVRYRYGLKHAIIEFDSSKPPDILLNKPVWIKNVKLDIKERKVYNDSTKTNLQAANNAGEEAGPISYETIKDVFDKKTAFDTQLRGFLSTVQLSKVEIKTRYASVCTQLDKIFKVVFPKCKTYKFGSTQTGLGFKECDLDIYMDIGEPVNDGKNPHPKSWTTTRIFREVRRIMYKSDSIFSNIILIPKAKTPIIKFWHLPTNVSCDISFKSCLGICNSYLIKFCITLDSRLKPLMLLIKYWARHFGISGSGKISNYALVLLIIFYLQQPSVNIIPPLMEFQRNCVPKLVDGWQVNFNDSAKLQPITNNCSIPQLLHGFFLFYATFEFKSRVICPLDGKTHTEDEFKNIESLPSSMDRYKSCVTYDDDGVKKFSVCRPLCVQDPIELVHNVTACASPSTLDSFVKHCAIGAEISAETSKNDYKDLMETLLTTALKNKANECKFLITIRAKHLVNAKITPEMKPTTEQTKFTESHWHITVFNAVKDIFEKVLKVQVEFLTADTGAKQQKIEIISDVHTKEHQKLILRCRGKYCLWRDRKTCSVFDPSLSALEKEILTSNRMIEKFKNEDSRRKINLDFTCTFEKKSHPPKVQLTLSNNNSDKSVFQEFACFAKCRIAEIIDRTLMHVQQYSLGSNIPNLF